VASNDRPPTIRPSAPAERASTQVSLAKRRRVGAGPVDLTKRVSLVKRSGRTRVSLVKNRPAGAPRPPARRRLVPAPTRVFAAATSGAARGARATRAWAERPSGRMALPGLLMGLLVALAVAGGTVLPHATDATPPNGPAQSGVPTDGPEAPGLPGEPGADPLQPSTGASAPGATGVPGQQAADSLSAWAAPMAVLTGIPLVALEAYAAAEIRMGQMNPNCGLRWTTLAGIGRVESNHGRSGNATLATDGRSDPPIYGPVLDGTGGNKRIDDTDDGELDGDSMFDRAIGPMQFIPSTWKKYAIDADGSGAADPHDIHDAALAAARLLCDGNRNLSTAQGWWDAIRTYNEPQAYGQNVFNAANDYGIRSRG
jgi:hypothetical protein